MTEPVIACPQCKTEIKLTESLAAPLVASTRREFEERLRKQELEIAAREAAVKKEQEAIEAQVATKLKAERAAIVAAEAKKARDAISDELNKAQQEKTAAEELLKDRNFKLAEAQRTE